MASRIQQPSTITPSVDLNEIQAFFDGALFPATKREILDVAYDNGAPDHILEFVNLLPDLEYYSLTDLILSLEDLQN